jgi:acetylornithine deacetylase
MLWAIADLVKHGSDFSGSLSLAAVMDEEMYAKGVEALIASGHRWDAAVIGEPTRLRIVTCHKGGVSFRIRCAGRAAHSSTPGLGVNAIYRMADILRLIKEEIAPSYVSHSHPLVGSPTISVGTIRGGRDVFTVADECVIEVNRRVLPGEDSGMVIAEIRAVLSKLSMAPGSNRKEDHIMSPGLGFSSWVPFSHKGLIRA